MMDEDWNVLMSFFPVDWMDLAVRTDAVKGLRKDKSASNLLRTLLIHIACGYSLRETVVRARRSGLADLSDVALLKRLRKCRDWLHAICVSLFEERGMSLGTKSGLAFRLFDATNVREPGKTGSLWRIHYSVQVPSLVCDFFKVTETKGEGTGESFTQFPVFPGDYIIADRGYCTASGIHYVASQEAFVCVRVNSQSLPMLDMRKGAFDLIGAVSKMNAQGALGWWPVLVPGPNQKLLLARLCAIRKSEEATRLARKKLRQNASKKGRELKPKTLFLAAYVIVLTNFPEEGFSTPKVLECYRIRWQIEKCQSHYTYTAKGYSSHHYLSVSCAFSFSYCWLRSFLRSSVFLYDVHEEHYEAA